MRQILAFTLALLSVTAQADVWHARYGVAETFNFRLYNADGTLDVDEADGGTEVSLSCNEGAETTATNDFADEGTFYSIALTATELQCERVAVVVAATTTEVFFIQTNSNASAMTPAEDTNLVNIAGAAVNPSSAQLGVNVVNFGGAAGTFASGRPEVNTSHWGGTAVASATVNANATQISGDATAADNLELAYDNTAGAVPWASIIDQGTAQAATGTTLQVRAAAAFADDEINGNFILITGGSAGVGQVRQITDYVSSTDTATVNTWTTTPSGTVTYQIVPDITAAGGGLTASDVWTHSTRSLTILDEDTTTLDLNATQIGSVATGGITEASFATTAGSFDAFGIVDQGTAQGATGTTLQLRSAASFADDEIIGATCVTTGGSAGVGQARTITDYVSSTDTATVAAWTTTPTGTITYQCFGTSSGSGGALTAADVWAYGTRSLTANPGLDAAGVRSAVGIASANLDTQLSGIESGISWNSAWDAEVQSEANDAIVANLLDQLLLNTYNPASPPGAVDSLLEDLVENDAGVTRFTTNSLENGPAGGGGSSDWTAGEREQLRHRLGIDGTATAPSTGVPSLATQASLNTVDDFLDTEMALLLSNIGTPSNLGSGATLAANSVDIESQTDDIGAAGAGLTSADDSVMTRLGAPTGASISADIATRASQSSVDTIDDFLDSEIAAIKAITDQMQFGVANQLNVNAESMNAQPLCGTGDTGTPWTGCP